MKNCQQIKMINKPIHLCEHLCSFSPELITYVSANANSFQAVTCAGIGSIPFEISVESHDWCSRFLFFTLFFSVDGILFCNCNEVVVWCVWINLPCRGLFLTSLAFSISRLENLICSRFDWAKFFNQFEIILIFPLEIVSVELNILEVQDKYLNLPPHPYDTILSWEIHSEPGRALWFSHTVKGLPSFPFSFSTFPLYSLEVLIT